MASVTSLPGVSNPQQGGWYWDASAGAARQFYNGSFGDPGVIANPNQPGFGGKAPTFPSTTPSVSPAAGGAGQSAPSSYSSVLSSLTGLSPDQAAYVNSESGVVGSFETAAAGVRAQEPLVRQTYATLADQLEQTKETELATAQRVGQTDIGKAEAYLANQGLQQAGGSLAEPVATAQANLQDKVGQISQKYTIDSENLLAQMNQDIASLEAKAAEYETQGQQAQADAIKEVIALKTDQEKLGIEYARLGQSRYSPYSISQTDPKTGAVVSTQLYNYDTKTGTYTAAGSVQPNSEVTRVGTTAPAPVIQTPVGGIDLGGIWNTIKGYLGQ